MLTFNAWTYAKEGLENKPKVPSLLIGRFSENVPMQTFYPSYFPSLHNKNICYRERCASDFHQLNIRLMFCWYKYVNLLEKVPSLTRVFFISWVHSVWRILGLHFQLNATRKKGLKDRWASNSTKLSTSKR